MRPALLAFVVAALLSMHTAVAQQPADNALTGPRAAVLPFINATGTDRYESLCEGLAALVAGDLANVDGFAVVERRDLDKMIAEQRFQHTGLTSADVHARFGRLLGADLLIVGTFTLDKGGLRIDVRAIGVSTARVAAAASATGPIGELLQIEKRVLNELVRLLARSDHKPRELSVDDTPEHTLHYIRGLGHFFENQYEAAIAEFMTLAIKDPDSELARYWLARSYCELKDHAHCAIECRRYLETFPDGGHVAEIQAILAECNKAIGATSLSTPAPRPRSRREV